MAETGVVSAAVPPPLAERLVAWVRGLSEVGWERVDAVAAVAIFLGFTTPALLGFPSHEGSAGAVVLFGAGASLPLAVRRRWPLPVLAVIVASVAIGTAAGVRFTPFVSNAGLGVALAMYTVADRVPRRLSLAALGGAFAVTWAATEIAVSAHPQQDHNAVHALAAVAGWCLGDVVRGRRAYRDELAARRHSESEERTRRGIAEERLRISREVHDVVSHNLSVIAVQSGMGRLVFDDQPEEARAALAQIETLSRGALDELRRLLSASLAPEPGLADLPALIERMTASGLDVRLDIAGEPRGQPPLLELAAYRIVQEALTNVIKHAQGAATVVRLRHRPDELEVEVVNDAGGGRAAAVPSGAGRGIVGMRERAALFGGSVVADARPGGGFRVVATLPTGPRR